MKNKEITDAEIDKLIRCHKRATNKPRTTIDFRHKKRNYTLQAADYPDIKFTLYYRQNTEDEEDYSVGLLAHFPDGSDLTLIRFNGSSHIHPNRIENTEIKWQTHIHIATERYIHLQAKAEGYAIETNEYQSVDEALQYATKYCNIHNITPTEDNLDLFYDT